MKEGGKREKGGQMEDWMKEERREGREKEGGERRNR